MGLEGSGEGKRAATTDEPPAAFLQRFVSVAEAMPIGVVVNVPGGRAIYANEPAAELAGFPSGESLVNATDEEVMERFRIVGEDGDPIPVEETPWRQVFQGAEHAERTAAYEHLITGERRIVKLHATALPPGDADPAYVVTFATDITDQRLAAQMLEEMPGEVEHAVAERTEELAFFRHLMDHTHDGVYVVDPGSGQITYANHAAATMLGYLPDELIGMPITAISAGIGDDATWATMVERIQASGSSIHESTHLTKRGKRIPVEVSASLVTSPRGEHIIGIVRDLRDRVTAEEELRASNQALQDFAYIISHDLREPLRMVRSYVSLLERRYGDVLDQDAKEFIEFAVDGVDRMEGMIQGLLSFSRVDTQGKPLRPVDLEEVLEAATANLTLPIEASGASITRDPLPRVNGDLDQLIQVFQNLVSNAIKFAGDEPPRIHVSATPHQIGWDVTVRDEGIGFDPDQAERAFLVFQRLHGSRDLEGTGMGLAIAKRIVERHQGAIWVDTHPGEGSTFHVVLPRAREEPATGSDRVRLVDRREGDDVTPST
ncbi:MAG: PAS domain S-box protein [Candidatus Thermoplasmatota archaeon]|nr:PAS domain S-box protein [Candidatus Thermoplasmatota archaeon]